MTELWLFFMALAVVYLLPGPDMILLLQTGARQGKGAALATALGLGVARGCHVALAALGLATLFRTAPWTFDVVRRVPVVDRHSMPAHHHAAELERCRRSDR